MKRDEILKIAVTFDARYKNLKCLSDDAREQTWSLIGQQIASDDWMKNDAQDDTDSVNKTICEPNEKRFKLMESGSDSEEGVENTSHIVQRHIMGKNVVDLVGPLKWWKLAFFANF